MPVSKLVEVITSAWHAGHLVRTGCSLNCCPAIMIPGWVITVTLDCPAVIGWYPGWYPANAKGKLLLNCQIANSCTTRLERLAIMISNFLYILLGREIRKKSMECEIGPKKTRNYITGYAWWHDIKVNGINIFTILCIIGKKNSRQYVPKGKSTVYFMKHCPLLSIFCSSAKFNS